jgi:hypothetical protein
VLRNGIEDGYYGGLRARPGGWVGPIMAEAWESSSPAPGAGGEDPIVLPQQTVNVGLREIPTYLQDGFVQVGICLQMVTIVQRSRSAHP